MKESAFLNQSEKSLLDEIERFFGLAGIKEFLELSPSQYKTWERIETKISRYPKDYPLYNKEKGTYGGCRIVNTAKRRLYTKRDNLKLGF